MASPRRFLRSSVRRELVDSVKRRPTQENKDAIRKLESRLADFALKHVRYGRQIRLHQLSSVPETSRERKIFDELVRKMEQKRSSGESVSQKRLIAFRTKVHVLRISAKLRAKLGGRNPTVFQILAVPALLYGLGSKELLRLATTMITVGETKKHKTWEGNVIEIYKTIRARSTTGRPLLGDMEKMLHRGTVPLNTKELAFALTGKRDVQTTRRINTGLQLLEVCGLVKKLPQSGTLSMWIHRSQKNPMINYPCVSMEMLAQLFQGTKLTLELHKQEKHHEGHRGNPDALFSHGSVYQAIKKLKSCGLVVSHSERRLTGKVGGILLTEVKLTPEAHALMEKYYREESLPEELRKLLIGEKEMVIEKSDLAKYPFE